jgi:HD superfamily phosphohydrolase
MENFRIIDNRVCFNQNYYHKVYDFYGNRYRLFKGLYLSPQVISFELMLRECFELTKEEYKWDELVYDKERYLYTTDHLWSEFHRHENPKVRDIIKRLNRRDNFKLAGELIFETQDNKRHSSAKIDQICQDIVNCQEHDGSPELRVEDVCLIDSQINYGS